jgi:Glu-tRNA(Gln) amidotransferase subunit E-like FAD-binding protein
MEPLLRPQRGRRLAGMLHEDTMPVFGYFLDQLSEVRGRLGMTADDEVRI